MRLLATLLFLLSTVCMSGACDIEFDDDGTGVLLSPPPAESRTKYSPGPFTGIVDNGTGDQLFCDCSLEEVPPPGQVSSSFFYEPTGLRPGDDYRVRLEQGQVATCACSWFPVVETSAQYTRRWRWATRQYCDWEWWVNESEEWDPGCE